MKDKYFEIVMMVERLHRLFLNVIKSELDNRKLADISNIQCLIIYNVGQNKMTVGEISNRGYYLGSNVTYNLKKLVENGYITQQQSIHDKRSSHVTLSEKGKEIFKMIENLIENHLKNLPQNQITEENLNDMHKTMCRLEHFWSFLSTRDSRFL